LFFVLLEETESPVLTPGVEVVLVSPCVDLDVDAASAGLEFGVGSTGLAVVVVVSTVLAVVVSTFLAVVGVVSTVLAVVVSTSLAVVVGSTGLSIVVVSTVLAVGVSEG
jgi:hypothetical protein